MINTEQWLKQIEMITQWLEKARQEGDLQRMVELQFAISQIRDLIVGGNNACTYSR